MDENKTYTNEHVYFVNQLYRDFLLPTILGDDNAAILYWAGKRVSRHYDLSSFEDVNSFFITAEFGELTKIKERRGSIILELSGQNVSDRLSSDSQEFSLEAGIIAEAIQREKKQTTECDAKILAKEQKVQFTASFD
ncbi:YslB family protein [Lactobacillus sp. ESL0791]|uniref:YslB family protein n=1 Tax=Lactobacillus sp. ESL0791 TaxID=2983234 RepID=UPI0023F928D2|nr:YslB family protein [Lactobacillus sp. ESL0791]MDF7638469.1 YslB family protein [Lactobacillus sp. ESL0791]